MSEAMLTYEAMLDRDLDWALREGSMHFEGESAVHKTLKRITERLEELGIDYAVAGGMAMFLHGYRRFTEDVDLLVTPEGLSAIHEHLEGRGYVRPFEKSKNLRDADTRVRIDFIITGQYPGDGRPGPVAFPNPRDVAEMRDGMRVLAAPVLAGLKLASGQSPNRRKDLGDVQELIRSLHLPLELREQLHPTLRDAYTELWLATQPQTDDDVGG